MYIITRLDIETNEIIILGYDCQHDESAYMRCFNLIMADVESITDYNISTQIMDKTFIKVFYRTWTGKYLMYDYELHLENE